MHGKAAKNEINSKKKKKIYIYMYILDPKQVTICQALQLESFAN